MSEGWISLHRQLRNNWVWKDKPFSKGQAWVDILLSCNHAENRVLIKGTFLDVKRGESVNSLKTWAKKWGWTISKVRRFFELLQKDSMIVLKNESITTRLSVCNYSIYQDSRIASETQAAQSRHGSDTVPATNNNVNNENNENNERIIDPPAEVLEDELRKIWTTVYLGNPGIVELDFVRKLYHKFGLEKAKRIIYNFKHKNFHSIGTMEMALNDDGTIKEKDAKIVLSGINAI